MAHQSNSAENNAAFNRVQWLVAALLVALLGYIGVAAWRLPIDYWDGFEYLNNARVLAGHANEALPLTYSYVRPPMIAWLLAPLMRFYQPHGAGAYTLAHLLMWAVAVLALWRVYRLYRQNLTPTAALAGVLLLAWNPAFFSQAPFVMADILSMLGAVLALELASRLGSPGWKAAVALGLAAAFAILSKYPLALALPLMAPAVLLVPPSSPRARARVFTQLLVGGIVTAAVVYVGHVVLFASLQNDWSHAWTHAFDGARTAFSVGGQAGEFDPAYEYVAAYWVLLTPPLFLISGFGLVTALRRRSTLDVLHAAWGVGFMLALSLAVPHKEMRYALPALPSWIYFAVLGMQSLWVWVLERAGSRLPRLAPAGFCVLLGAMPLAIAARELGRFQDPIYHQPFLATFSRYVSEQAESKATPLMADPTPAPGFVYTLYARDPVMLPLDEFWHFHHLSSGALSFFLNRFPKTVPPAIPPSVDALARWAAVIEDRGVVLSSQQGWFETHSADEAPEPPRPLEVHVIERRTFVRETAEAISPATYRELKGREPALALTFDNGRWVTTAADEKWQVYARQAADQPLVRWRADLPPPALLEWVAERTRAFGIRE